MKKIAFLVTGLNSGGLENYLLRFLTFYKNDIEATIICKGGYIGDLKYEFEALNAKIIPIEIGYFNPFKFYKLYRIFKKNNFDSICDFTGNFACVPLALSRFANIEKRIAFHRGSNNRFKETPIKLAYNKAINKLLPSVATKILANSKTAMEFFHKGLWHNKNMFEVIYNGINSREFLNTDLGLRKELEIPSSAFVIGHVGRYNESKNHNTIIEVAIDLCKQNKDVYFVLCGKGVDEHLWERVNSENLLSRIKLLGFRRDIIKVLNTLDCFYFPSIAEGQPNALIEAMVVGLPFIASDINPIKETVPVMFHSQLVSPNNKKEAIEKIINIKKNGMRGMENSISNWAKDYFEPEYWFSKFFKLL